MNVDSPNSTSNQYPKAYRVGIQDFYGRDFIVSPDVLIPRPETEQIIDATLNLVGKPYLEGVLPAKAKINSQGLHILDVGTGSGCIAITLKLVMPEADVTAVDISEKALKIAQKNAAKYSATITTIISDLLENVKFTPDLVVANLPYVDQSWPWLDKKSLSFEPNLALYAKDHGLLLIKRLIDQCQDREVPYLILEADPSQHQSIINYANAKNYYLLETRGFILTFDNPQVLH